MKIDDVFTTFWTLMWGSHLGKA